MSTVQFYHSNKPFILSSGAILPEIRVAYHTYGTYQKGKSKVIWVCHALTANSDVFDWWKGLFGENDFFNPRDYFIVCANVLGSCYGTTGPTSDEVPSVLKYENFPIITPFDMAKAHLLLADELQIERVHLAIGASLGGQQALELSIQRPDWIENLVLIATNAIHSPFGKAFNESQRLAIYADATWGNGTEKDARNGLIAARSLAMLSYRSYEGYGLTQQEEDERIEDFKAASYQRYQGEKLANRFNAYAYVTLSKAMDAHHIGRNREGIEAVLAGVKAKTLVIGISSDLLFPTSEQQYLAKWIPKAKYIEIDSIFGHDGFLVELPILSGHLQQFVNAKLVVNTNN